jgi:uncharacterized protein
MSKVSLVTGASSGLGRDIAMLLCGGGNKVYVTARRRNLLEELKRECSKFSGEIIPIPGDLSKLRFRKKLIDTLIKKEGRIDYLINNAGFGRSIQFEKQKPNEIQNMVNVNIVAYVHLTNLVLGSMKKVDSGRIINIGSVVAFTPLPYFTLYNATKSAVYSFNRSLRYELKNSNVTSTVVLPARMRTGFAKVAYDCYEKDGKVICVESFNKLAGDPMIVARKVVKNIDKGKEVITPTLKAKLWYFMRYFGWLVELSMKNILGPKELSKLKEAKHKK